MDRFCAVTSRPVATANGSVMGTSTGQISTFVMMSCAGIACALYNDRARPVTRDRGGCRRQDPEAAGDRKCVTSARYDRLKSKGAFTMNKCGVLGLLIVSLFVTGVALAVNDATQGAGGRRLAKATFAGGGFWCMEEALDKVDGVVSTTSGYTGGKKKKTTHQERAARGSRHAEAGAGPYC